MLTETRLPLRFRHYSPALALTLLDPKLDFIDSETASGIHSGTVVGRSDGSGFSPHDLRRLQVGQNQHSALNTLYLSHFGTVVGRADDSGSP